MREIKFRAWHREDAIMSEPFTIWDVTDGFFKYADFVFGYETDVELMQYTGLKCNKRLPNGGVVVNAEIYEGDIVRWAFVKYEVRYDLDTLGFGFFPVGNALEVDNSPVFWEDAGETIRANLEAIGNIYENPELLENKQ